jgi:hypothetical protein
MQDHDTAKELIQFVKPLSHSFVARVYEPLTIVLEDAHRADIADPYRTFFQAAAEKHFFPFALIIVLSIAVVTLLVNYLLWDQFLEDEISEPLSKCTLSMRTLSKAHSLDIVKISSTNNIHLLTIGLDRLTVVWQFNASTSVYSKVTLRTTELSPPFWPIIASAIDGSGTLLALCTDKGAVTLWDTVERHLIFSAQIDLDRNPPPLFAFAGFVTNNSHQSISLVVVTTTAVLYQLDVHSLKSTKHQISNDVVVSACFTNSSRNQSSVATSHAGASIIISSFTAGGWSSRRSNLQSNYQISDGDTTQALGLSAVRTLGLVAAYSQAQVELVDNKTLNTVYCFKIGQIRPHSLRIIHSPRRLCTCNAPAVSSLSLVYTEAETQDCIIQTFTPASASQSLICLGPPNEASQSCQGFNKATETIHKFEHPGIWEATRRQSVIGVRKHPTTGAPDFFSSGNDASSTRLVGTVAEAVRHRGSATTQGQGRSFVSFKEPKYTDDEAFDSDQWEAWIMSSAGEIHTQPLFRNSSANKEQNGFKEPFKEDDDDDDDDVLFFAKPGPITPSGKTGVAVVLGNIVKVIFPGNSQLEEDTDEYEDPVLAAVQWRRSRGLRRRQSDPV